MNWCCMRVRLKPAHPLESFGGREREPGACGTCPPHAATSGVGWGRSEQGEGEERGKRCVAPCTGKPLYDDITQT